MRDVAGQTYKVVTWPMRPLTRRVVEDLRDFAGITQPQLVIGTLVLWVAVKMTRIALGYESRWGLLMILVWTVVQVLGAILPKPALAAGLDVEPPMEVSGWIIGFLFWLATFRLLAGFMDHATDSVEGYSFVATYALATWGDRGPGRGEPFLSKVKRSASARLASIRPSPVATTSATVVRL